MPVFILQLTFKMFSDPHRRRLWKPFSVMALPMAEPAQMPGLPALAHRACAPSEKRRERSFWDQQGTKGAGFIS